MQRWWLTKMVSWSDCFQVAMNLSTISSQACQVRNILWECVLMLLISSQSSKIQLSQLCTILGPLHNPGPMSRVLWDVFTDRAPHAGDPYKPLYMLTDRAPRAGDPYIYGLLNLFLICLLCDIFFDRARFTFIHKSWPYLLPHLKFHFPERDYRCRLAKAKCRGAKNWNKVSGEQQKPQPYQHWLYVLNVTKDLKYKITAFCNVFLYPASDDIYQIISVFQYLEK